MITKDKVEVFKRYKGFYDWYYFKNSHLEREVSDSEWNVLSNLMQDIFLIRTDVASEGFRDITLKKLNQLCDSVETVDFIFCVERELHIP